MFRWIDPKKTVKYADVIEALVQAGALDPTHRDAMFPPRKWRIPPPPDLFICPECLYEPSLCVCLHNRIIQGLRAAAQKE